MTASPDTVFGKILRKEIPAQLVYEDDRCIVIRDIAPKAPVHLLVIPREPLANLGEAAAAQEPLLGHLLFVAQAVAKKENVGDAFRLVINNGEAAGQSVHHLHVHVLGGRTMKWPPG
jgi:histidine triad (HIT) family protein